MSRPETIFGMLNALQPQNADPDLEWLYNYYLQEVLTINRQLKLPENEGAKEYLEKEREYIRIKIVEIQKERGLL